ncbi:MAG: FAD-dependent oxidoreductase [Candidatus Kerfeldbacteria bacterium]|nr:FAD-dependent oxidoreductase [Candidatus Kerfeldbacteria bacterium]
MTVKSSYDLVIVGASAAGIAAAIYAARRNLRFAVYAADIGGEVATSGIIENYPGFPTTDGIALTEEFKKQLQKYAVEVVTPARVERIERTGESFTLHVRRGDAVSTTTAATVIVATGVHPRHLEVPGEREFTGKGVTYCTTCDGPLYKGKTVTVVGGGNSALEAGIMLAGIATDVTVLTIHEAMRGDTILIENLQKLPNVHVRPFARTTSIVGEQVVQALTIRDEQTGKEERLPTQGVFVHIGLIPNAELVADLVRRNDVGEIVVNARCETGVPGLYAAGDVTNTPYKQIAIATGQGVTAALGVVEYLNHHGS